MLRLFAVAFRSVQPLKLFSLAAAVVAAASLSVLGQPPGKTGVADKPAGADEGAGTSGQGAPAEKSAKGNTSSAKAAEKKPTDPDESKDKQGRRIVRKTEAAWAKLLTPAQFKIMRKKGTERAFTGNYWDHHDDGVYRCAGCGEPLFDSKTKFESGTGWPSFTAPVSEDALESETDKTLGLVRTEVVCRCCEAHLGHVFDDGPKPTGLRYCINSATLKFSKRDESEVKKEPAAESTGSQKVKPTPPAEPGSKAEKPDSNE